MTPATSRDRLLLTALAIAILTIAILAGVLIVSAGGGDPPANPVPTPPTADPRAADRRDIAARALAYQKALDPNSPEDPCNSIALRGDVAMALADPELRTQGCKVVIRDRDAALQGARPRGVTDIRFVPRVETGFGNDDSLQPGAEAVWRADPRLTVGFIQERGRWVIAR